MSGKLVTFVILIAILIAGMFFLASIDVEKETVLIEKPVIGETLEQ